MSARVVAGIEIDAPIALVWLVMTDLPAYGAWNPFITAAEGRLEPGGALLLTVRWRDGTGLVAAERVTEVVGPRGGTARLDYHSEGWIDRIRMVRARRIQELTELPDGRTRYDTVESFSGWGVRWVPLDKVKDGFDRHAAALKQRAESRRVP